MKVLQLHPSAWFVLAAEHLLKQVRLTPAEEQRSGEAPRIDVCAIRQVDEGFTYYCSRDPKHRGPHLACPGHDLNRPIVAIWPGSLPKVIELPEET